MSLRCALFGHEKVAFDAFRGGPFIQIRDALGDALADVELCARCRLVFWEISHPIKRYGYHVSRKREEPPRAD